MDNEYLYIYKRILNENVLLVINSFSRKKHIYDISRFNIKNVLLSNYKTCKINKGKLTMRPFESLVFEIEEIL